MFLRKDVRVFYRIVGRIKPIISFIFYPTNRIKTNNWTKRYENVSTLMDCNQDSRKWMIAIRYNFGLSNIKVQKESANTESLGRR